MMIITMMMINAKITMGQQVHQTCEEKVELSIFDLLTQLQQPLLLLLLFLRRQVGR
jgi:hypothetical protein